MRGIRSCMGWTHIPDVDSGTKTSDDNPFAGPKLQTPGKSFCHSPYRQVGVQQAEQTKSYIGPGLPFTYDRSRNSSEGPVCPTSQVTV